MSGVLTRCFAALPPGPYDDFTVCYTALPEWIEREGYALSGPPVELYIKGYDDGIRPIEYVTEIYFPIQK
jgi:effector-binding domain-containing protein